MSEQTAIDDRLKALESWVATTEAVTLIKDSNALSIQERLEKRIEKIEGALSKLMWILLAGLGGSAVSFIINGGLSLAQP